MSKTGQIVASSDERVEQVSDVVFAAGGRVLVNGHRKGNDHEIGFYDLVHPDRPPRVFPGDIFPFRWRFRPMADWWLVDRKWSGGGC